MRRYVLFASILVLTLICASLLAGCGSRQSAILGAWQLTGDVDELGLLSFFAFVDRIEFLKDGTFVLPNFMNMSGSYSFPDKGKITFQTTSYGSTTYDYELSGDTLTFYESGTPIVFERAK